MRTVATSTDIKPPARAVAACLAQGEGMPADPIRNRLRDKLWKAEDVGGNHGHHAGGCDIDDLRRDVLLDRLAHAAPECVADLLELADRVIEVG